MTTSPSLQELYAVTEATWPPAEKRALGPWSIRKGAGGGNRVSATTANRAFAAADLAQAEAAMVAMGQPCLFMVRQGDAALDALLAEHGYVVKDPVTLYVADIGVITAVRPPTAMAFRVWPPLEVEREIWAKGGIGPARLAVMERVKGPKTTILGRNVHTPSGALFVAIHGTTAMMHAIDVLLAERRKGVAQKMIRAAGFWAAEHGATHLSLVVTQANDGANALYASMGFQAVGQYHYRIKPE